MGYVSDLRITAIVAQQVGSQCAGCELMEPVEPWDEG